MTLRPEYALGHSELNTFLYAAAGRDDGGGDVTTLSILARLGFDPWAEAGRLAALPHDAAVQALTALLCRASRKTADTDGIAARLVSLLPRPGAPPVPTPQIASVDNMRMRPPIWLICIVAAVAWYCLLSYMKADTALEPPQHSVTTQ